MNFFRLIIANFHPPGEEPLSPRFDNEEVGVYLVELESRDKPGRAPGGERGLFAGRNEPVIWSRPPARGFKTRPKKRSMSPARPRR